MSEMHPWHHPADSCSVCGQVGVPLPRREDLTADEWRWLEGAASRASKDNIASGLGTRRALAALAKKCGANAKHTPSSSGNEEER